MKSKIEKAYDPELFRSMAHELVDQMAEYLENSLTGKAFPVLPNRNPEDLHAKYQTMLRESDEFESKRFFAEFIQDSIHLHHPGYIGHQVCAPVPLASAAGFLGDLLNNGSAVFDMGPANTAIEKVLIELVCRHFGYNADSDGIFTSGGSIGNLTALLAAKRFKLADTKSDRSPAFLISDQSHYSIAKSLKIIGFEPSDIFLVPSNDRFSMNTNALYDTLSQAEKLGKRVIGVVASACSTATGSYDNLKETARFAQENGLWLHVDGAHGSAAIFSKRYRELLDGIDQADSIVIDFHKMLMAPALITAVLFRDSNHSYQTFAEKANYLWNEPEHREWFNFSKRTLECTKRSLGLKVFIILKAYGEELFAENVERLFDLARDFAGIISERRNFELAVPPQSNIVCFRYSLPKQNREQLNELNLKIKNRIVEAGKYYVVQTDLRGDLYLRTALMNPFTTLKDLKILLDDIEEIALRLQAA
jgi:L-2,4-diaminobutyrate decarboxylase